MAITNFWWAELHNALFQQERKNHWNKLADFSPKINWFSSFYRLYINDVYKSLIRENLRILELGCGDGTLLDYLKPSYGMGVDFSEKTIEIAKKKT